MNTEDIQKLIKLRSVIIETYNALKGKNNFAAVIKESQVAVELESYIKGIDDILKGKVDFR